MVDETGAGTTDAPSPSALRQRKYRDRKLRRKLRWKRYYRSSKQRQKQHAFWGYAGLVDALIARRHALGWTQLELDERAGFQSGYAAKLENWRGPQGRVAGSVTMTLWLEALGLGFVPVSKFDGPIGEQLKRLATIERPKLPPADHNKRIPKEP